MDTVFAPYHPVIGFEFLVFAVVISMVTLQPVYVVLSVAGALVCSLVVRGGRATLRSFAWIVPVWLLVALLNPLFSQAGSTLLWTAGPLAIYAESLVYGVCAGGMLVAVLLWFSACNACLSADRIMALFGNAMPVVSLMVSQVMRLVPQMLRRGRMIMATLEATNLPVAKPLDDRLRVTSVLMGWGMEDGIVRSDAMRSRGYGAGTKRTTYRRYRFDADDAVLAAIIGVLGVAALVLAVSVGGRFWFYPTLAVSELGTVACYVPGALFVLVPVVLWMKERWQWR